MQKLKNKKVGRPKYKPDIEQLKQLFKKVADKTITNEEGWRSARLSARHYGIKWRKYIGKPYKLI